MSNLSGSTVGPYRIIAQIGVGGMATVYKAYQPSMERYVAIKVLPHYLSQDPDFVKRFQREARAIAKLEHAHILPVHDYGEADGITYIAMRYVDAGTLKERMAQGLMSLDEINRIIGQIGSALDYAHRLGVIHRDVKPGNVLIDEQADTYLSDFGLARVMEASQQLTASGVGVGTPAYMSPEQGQGIKVDHRSDIYSLGVILYEMVTGRVPFEAETPMAVMLKHITDPLPLPRSVAPDVPESVEQVILKAMAKDPADRYQTAGEMAQALATAVRQASAAEPHPAFTAEAVPMREDISFVTRVQRIWETPRGKVGLVGSAAVVFVLLGLLLSQLPGSVEIRGPAVTATRAIAQATTAPTASPTATAVIARATTAPTASPTPAVPAEVAALSWEQLSDGASFLRVALNALAVDPNDPNTIFAGTYGAGIYISRDGGQTWEPSNEGLGKGTVGTIAIDPADSNIVYAAMYDQGGVYKSTDGGRTWRAANLGLDLDHVGGWSGFIAVAPSDHDTLYYAPGFAGGIGISNDAGESWLWQSVNCPQITKLVIDPKDAKHLYANNDQPPDSDCAPGVYETGDGGLTWTRRASPEMAGDWWQQLAVDPRDFNIIYATGGQAGVFKSTDGGATWKKILARGCWWLDTNPGDDTVYCGQENVMLSRDGGATWVRTDFGPLAGRNDGHPFAVAPGDPQTLYAGSSIIMKSTDGGQTVSSLGSLGMVRMDISVDPRDGQRLFLGGTLAEVRDSPCFTYRSTDAAQSWQVIVNSSGGNCLVVTGPASPDLFLRADQGNGFLRSTDNGDNWQLGGGVPNIRHILPDPVDAKKLWIGGGNTISVSEDGGKTFAAVHEIASSSLLQVMLIDPTGKRVYALTDWEFHRWDDGGATWKVLNGPRGGYRAAIIDPTNPDVVYAGSTHKGVLKTTDGGEWWRQINTGLSNNLGVNDLALDPRNPQTVYAATDAGAFVTLDGGEQWSRIQTGLGPNPIVYSIAVDPNDSSKVYAATPDGVYRLAGFTQPTEPIAAATSTVTATPLDPLAAQARAFAEPILAAIADRPPDFGDDFSTANKGWILDQGGTDLNAKITDGVLRMSAAKPFPGSFASHYALTGSDFVLQLEFLPKSMTSNSSVSFDFRNRGGPTYALSFIPDFGTWGAWCGRCEQSLELGSGTTDEVKMGEWAKLLIIAKGPEVAVYVNNKPLTYFRDDSLSSGVIRIGMNPLVPNTEVEFDNVRFWNLANVPGLP